MSGSTSRPRAPEWSEAEEAQLRAMMPDHRLVDIARAMGRSWAAINKKCSRMGLLGQHAGARSRETPAPITPPPDAPNLRDDPSPLPPFHPVSLAALAKVGPAIEPPRKPS